MYAFFIVQKQVTNTFIIKTESKNMKKIQLFNENSKLKLMCPNTTISMVFKSYPLKKVFNFRNRQIYNYVYNNFSNSKRTLNVEYHYLLIYLKYI